MQENVSESKNIENLNSHSDLPQRVDEPDEAVRQGGCCGGQVEQTDPTGPKGS